MDAQNNDTTLEPRFLTLDDILLLCRRFNEAAVNYVVIGEFAVIQYGYARTSANTDVLVEASPDNLARIKNAVLGLPDGVIHDVQPDDLNRYAVVRVGDEFVVDLKKAVCGIEYLEASRQIWPQRVRGVSVPFANAPLLLRLKQAHRAKDVEDRLCLLELVKERSP